MRTPVLLAGVLICTLVLLALATSSREDLVSTASAQADPPAGPEVREPTSATPLDELDEGEPEPDFAAEVASDAGIGDPTALGINQDVFFGADEGVGGAGAGGVLEDFDDEVDAGVPDGGVPDGGFADAGVPDADGGVAPDAGNPLAELQEELRAQQETLQDLQTRLGEQELERANELEDRIQSRVFRVAQLEQALVAIVRAREAVEAGETDIGTELATAQRRLAAAAEAAGRWGAAVEANEILEAQRLLNAVPEFVVTENLFDAQVALFGAEGRTARALELVESAREARQ